MSAWRAASALAAAASIMSERPGSLAAVMRFSASADRGLVAIMLGDRIVELRLGDPTLVEQRPGAVEIVVG